MHGFLRAEGKLTPRLNSFRAINKNRAERVQADYLERLYEGIARRIQAIVDAHDHGGQTKYQVLYDRLTNLLLGDLG